MPTVFGAESHEEELRRQQIGRDTLRRSQAEGWERLNTPTRPGAYYVVDPATGKIYSVKSYGGLEQVNDPSLSAQYRKSEFDRQLAKYDTESQKKRDLLTQGFRTESEYAGARQAGAVAATAGLEGQRRNLGDEFTAALGAQAQTALRSNVLDAQLGFEQRMNVLQYQNRDQFLNGTFNFFRGLQMLEKQAEIAKDMARFQAQLQSDLNSRNLFGDMLDLGFTVLGMGLLGPAGGAAGAIGGAAFPGGPAGREDYGYGVG